MIVTFQIVSVFQIVDMQRNVSFGTLIITFVD